MTCVKCERESDHSIQIRKGDPTRKGNAPDKSSLNIVRLCQEHWEELCMFLGVRV